MTARTSLAILVLLGPAASTAAPPDDGYCDYVEGSAAATADPLYAPELYGEAGHIEQPTFAVAPVGDPSNLRVIGGVRYSLSNLVAGKAITSRARADCRRHEAQVVLRGAIAARALAARIRVYDDAQAEADRIVEQIGADLEAQRTTAPEATAMRMRAEELRTLAASARSELAALPPPDPRPLAKLVTDYRIADADIETSEARLRMVNAFDVSVRVGVDSYLDGSTNRTDYVAVMQVGVNLGALWMGRHNERAARGRSRYARTGFDSLGVNATVDQLRARMDIDARRLAQVKVLVTDLDHQLDTLAKLGSEASKHYRETLWFEWVQAKAELAYLQAYVEALGEVIGAHAP
jgi:hypothetical protein